MTSQKESSTEYNPFVISKADLDKIDYIRENLNYINEPHAAWESSANYLNREIDYLRDMVRHLSLEVSELRIMIKNKGIVFDESCDERYAENWRET